MTDANGRKTRSNTFKQYDQGHKMPKLRQREIDNGPVVKRCRSQIIDR